MEKPTERVKNKKTSNVRLKHILFLFLTVLTATTQANKPFALKTVVIDPGHGGKDPGAIGPGKTNEKDIALVVALKLGDYISKNYPDVNVVYTRKTDVFLELHERAEIANKVKADLFIAVHINSSPNTEVYGTSTYVLGLHRTEANLEVAKRENSVINLEDNKDQHYEFDPNSPEGHIIMSMKQNAFLDQSIDFASKAESQLENYAKRKSLGVKQAGFYVLYKTTMPSILAEIGFISNPEEEKFMNTVKGQDLIATALFNAFKDYKTELEGSEGAQYAYEQAIEKQQDQAANTNTAVKQPEVKTEKPAAPQTSATANQPTAVKNTAPASASTEQASTTISSGAKIRKPIENSSGGGKATGAKSAVYGEQVQPIYVTNTNVNPFDTTSFSALMNKKNESKAVVAGNEKAETAGTEAKTEVKEPRPEVDQSNLVPAHKTESGTVLKIQLFALKGGLKDYDKITKLFGSEISSEELPNGFTRFYGGKVKTYNEAKTLLEKAKAAGYNAAFIVGFKNGTRMSNDELNALTGQ